MAGNIKGICIEFRGDTTKLDKAMREIKNESKSIDQQLREVNRSLKFNPGNAELLKQKFTLLNQKIDATESQLKQFQNAEKQLRAQGVSEESAEWMTLRRNIIEAESKLKHYNAELKKVQYANITKMGEAFKKAGQKMRTAGTYVTIGGGAMILAGKKLLALNRTQSQAETKLTEIYKTRMGATDKAAQSTMKLASKLQKEGVVGDEVALSGAQQLATYAKMPSTVNKLLPSMENLLVQQKGVNATAEDATSIANLFGKAMMGQTGALKRVGISFTDAQEKVLKYGTEEEKAAMLSEVVTQNVGNMNQKFAETDEGKMAQLRNTLGDIGERLGSALLPALASMASWIQEHVVPAVENLVSFVEEHPIIMKIALGITTLLTVGGPLLIFLGALVSSIGTITAALPVLGGAFTALLGPVGLVIAGIAAAIAAGVALYKNWDKVKATASKVWNAIKNAITKPIKAAVDFVKRMIEKIKSFFKFKVSLPHIKLPHFAIQPQGWSLGDLLEGIIPHLGIDWYAQGGIFNSPRVIGVGDSKSPEAVIPIDKLQSMINASNAQMVSAIVTALQAMNTGNNGKPVELVVNLGGAQVATQIFKLNKQGQIIMEA